MPHLLVEYKEDKLIATVRTEGRSGGYGDYEQGIQIMGKLISDYGFSVTDEYALTGEQKARILKVGTDPNKPVEERVQYILALLKTVSDLLVGEGVVFTSQTEVVVIGEFEYPLPEPEPMPEDWPFIND